MKLTELVELLCDRGEGLEAADPDVVVWLAPVGPPPTVEFTIEEVSHDNGRVLVRCVPRERRAPTERELDEAFDSFRRLTGL